MRTPRLEEHLRILKLPGALASYKRLSEGARDPVAYLVDVMSAETERRQENRIKTRIAGAHFPTLKSFDNLGFSAQDGVPKLKLLELTDCRFIRERQNVDLLRAPWRRQDALPIGNWLGIVYERTPNALHDGRRPPHDAA